MNKICSSEFVLKTPHIEFLNWDWLYYMAIHLLIIPTYIAMVPAHYRVEVYLAT